MLIFDSSNEDSFSRGVYSVECYERTNTRRMVSLQMCFVGWLYELVGTVMTLLTPLLRDKGFHLLYYPDAILMFIFIPFIHLMNDIESKTVIAEQGWIKGLRRMFQVSSSVAPAE